MAAAIQGLIAQTRSEASSVETVLRVLSSPWARFAKMSMNAISLQTEGVTREQLAPTRWEAIFVDHVRLASTAQAKLDVSISMNAR